MSGVVVQDVARPAEGPQVAERIWRAVVLQFFDVMGFEPSSVSALLAAVAIPLKTPPPRPLPSGSAQFDVVVAHRIALHGTLSGWPMPYPSPCNRGLQL